MFAVVYIEKHQLGDRLNQLDFLGEGGGGFSFNSNSSFSSLLFLLFSSVLFLHLFSFRVHVLHAKDCFSRDASLFAFFLIKYSRLLGSNQQ